MLQMYNYMNSCISVDVGYNGHKTMTVITWDLRSTNAEHNGKVVGKDDRDELISRDWLR